MWRGVLLTAAFGVAAAMALVSLLRLTEAPRLWRDAADAGPLAGWMTPRLVAHARAVPPGVIAAALGLSRDDAGRRVSLDRLAAARGEPVAELIAALEQAMADWQAPAR